MPAPESRLLHEWLWRTGEAFPESVAIVEEDRVTSFGELLAHAEALAATFVDLGVRQGDRVALVMPKTTEAIVAVFASLRAGAAYVPIPPRWPEERIATALRDCQARVVVSVRDGPPRIACCEGSKAIEWEQALSPRQPPFSGPRVQSADPALILFTSGSTGRPKGVVLSHRAVSVFVRWCVSQFGISAQDRVASPSPLGFDLSTFDIFSMALCGAACVLVPEHIVWMPRFVVQLLRHTRITCWYSVPSILTGMLRDGGFAEGGNPSLRLVLFAGEVFSTTHAAGLLAAVPHAMCVNLYGPTETNVVSWYTLPPAIDVSQPIPIGRACPYAMLTLDQTNGELLAAGESVMTEYCNLPEETARAFSVIEGKRYYRTGDRVSLGASGDYTFLGRLDRQVKRRGFRLELGEIEAALGRHDSVLEAAAVAGRDGDLGTVVTVFIRARPAAGLSPIAVHAYCARSLPSYMLPDRVVFVDAVPRGSRGKIDYAALEKAAGEPHHGD